MVKNMKFNYFPGCTLKNKAKDLDRYARLCADKLGVELCGTSPNGSAAAVFLQRL